jgi:hypothetical protein
LPQSNDGSLLSGVEIPINKLKSLKQISPMSDAAEILIYALIGVGAAMIIVALTLKKK